MAGMKAAATGVLAIVLAAGAPAWAAPPAPIVFFDIAGPELAKQAAFYRTVFGWDVGEGGAVTVPVATPLPGSLRVEPSQQGPLTERLIYLGVPDITATLEVIKANGGGVVFPRLEVPGVAVVALFTDPAGNRMGLVEMEGAKAKVPKKP